MSNKHNLPISINQNNMRNTFSTIVIWCWRTTSMEVLNLFPFLSFNMLGYCWNCLINRNTNDSHFITPSFPIVLNHFLVMSHWSLTRWTPGCPEIYKHNLSLFMRKRYFFFCPNINNFFYFWILASSSNTTFNLIGSCSWVNTT